MAHFEMQQADWRSRNKSGVAKGSIKYWMQAKVKELHISKQNSSNILTYLLALMMFRGN